MNRFELLFDYGYWHCEIGTKHGRFWSVDESLVKAIWRAWRKSRQFDIHGEER